MTVATTLECSWCAGSGLDLMTGGRCEGCCEQAASMAVNASTECPWCAGAGVDFVSGEVCRGCKTTEDAPGSEEAAVDADPTGRSAGGRRRSRKAAQVESKVSLRDFVTEAQANKGMRRRRMLIPFVEATPEDVINSASPLRRRLSESTPQFSIVSPQCVTRTKVRFNLEVEEYPITPKCKFDAMEAEELTEDHGSQQEDSGNEDSDACEALGDFSVATATF